MTWLIQKSYMMTWLFPKCYTCRMTWLIPIFMEERLDYNPEIHRLTWSFTGVIERHGKSQKLLNELSLE